MSQNAVRQKMRFPDIPEMPGQVTGDEAEVMEVVEERPHGLDDGVDAGRLPRQAFRGEPLGKMRLEGGGGPGSDCKLQLM